MKRYKQHILVAVLGAISALAFAPVFVLPALMIGFSGFWWIFRKADSPKQAFWLGWSFGFGHHIAGLYWISASLLVDPWRFAWMIPFAISLIPAAAGLYTGLAAWITYRLGKKLAEWLQLILFALFWVAVEWLRAHLIFPFPWNLMGYSWAVSDAMLQSVRFISIYGLSFLAVLFGLLPLFFYKRLGNRIAGGVIVLCLSASYMYGVSDLAATPAGISLGNTKPITIRLVQPNIKQTLKWDPQEAQSNLFTHMDLSIGNPKDEKPDLIIWPEAPLAYHLIEDKRLRQLIASILQKPDAKLITGTIREENGQYYNSVIVMDERGEVRDVYDKHLLVPFGEYVPLRSVFPFINKITPGDKDFSPGSGPRSIQLKGEWTILFSPLICYEAIFPGKVVDAKNRPNLLINVTNDAWFGATSGPYQHLHMARVRAIEEGLPLLRVANTGISAIIDPKGRIMRYAPINDRDIIDLHLP